MIQNLWFQTGRSLVEFYVRHILKANIARETELPKGAKILAVNHPSTNDPAFITALLKEQSSVLIKETLFKVPVFGRSLRLAGHVPVIKNNGRAALEEAVQLLKKGRTVIIFPEGEISPEHGQLKAHSGMARLALITGAPVVPVGISLDYRHLRIIPTRVEGKDEPSAWYLHGPYAMTIGEAQVFSGDVEDRELVRQVTEQIMQRVQSLQKKGWQRIELAQRQAAIHAAQTGAVMRAARWAKYSVAIRAIQSFLFFLIAAAGKV